MWTDSSNPDWSAVGELVFHLLWKLEENHLRFNFQTTSGIKHFGGLSLLRQNKFVFLNWGFWPWIICRLKFLNLIFRDRHMGERANEVLFIRLVNLSTIVIAFFSNNYALNFSYCFSRRSFHSDASCLHFEPVLILVVGVNLAHKSTQNHKIATFPRGFKNVLAFLITA